MRQLLVLIMAGTRYGVWEDEIVAVRDVPGIHRIPLSPACIAGMSILDDRTVTLADLAVCLGLPPLGRDRATRLLMMSDQEKVAGFVVEEGMGRVPVPPDSVLPMPEYLRTPVVDSCVLNASELIPVINIGVLFGRIQKADREPPVAEFIVPSSSPLDTDSLKSVRVFNAGREPFAASAAGLEEEALSPGRVTKLALIPPYVKGIVHHEKKVLPLIRLAQRMKLPRSGTEGAVIPADLSGAPFGFLVDDDGGTLFSRDFSVSQLPPLARSSWVRAAMIHKGEVLPLIDLGMLMSPKQAQGEVPLPDRYHPDSAFHSQFGKEEVVLAEFSLLGVRHALPKAEVEDTVPFKAYRAVPNVQPIIIGVTDHEGELMPVLDLASVFGRRSIATPEWKMVLVRNGDFRALVITESYFGERRLPVEQQRAVPIVLPHTVVYGCYPDRDVVRLILNVEALAVHFDLALVKSFLGAISKEMEEAPAELVPSLLPEEYTAAASVAAATGEQPVEARADTGMLPETKAEPELASAGVAAKGHADREREGGEEEALTLSGEEEAARLKAAEEARLQEEERAGSEETERLRREAEERARREEADRERAEAEEKERLAAAERERAEVEERARAEEAARLKAEEEARAEAETREAAEQIQAEEAARLKAAEEARLQEEERAEAEERARREEADRERSEAEEKERLAAAEREHAEAEERAQAEEAERLRLEAEERSRREAEEQAAALARAEEEERARQEAAARAGAEAAEQAQREAEEEETVVSTSTVPAEAETAAAGAVTGVPVGPGAGPERTEPVLREVRREKEGEHAPVLASRPGSMQESEEPRPKKSRLVVVLIAVALVVLFYLLGVFRKPRVEEALRERPPAVAKKDTRREQPPVAAKKEAPAPAMTPAPQGKPEEPLVLKVPKDTVVEGDVYIVKKGDTLWHICRRFTGDPFNYPRVAKDNAIANPDLIFPDQKIRIIREE